MNMIKYTRPTPFIYAIACLISCQMLFGAACSSDTSEEIPTPKRDAGDLGEDSIEDISDIDDATRVAQLILSPDPVEAVVTQSIQINFRAYNAEGLQLDDAAVIWRVEDTQIATVNESGLLSALEVGQTRLVATSGDADESVEVRVRSLDAIERIEILPQQREVGVGENLALVVTAYDSADIEVPNLNLPVDWQSDAPDTATIDAEGNLAGLERGEVGVLARVGELEARAEFRVELKFDTMECENSCFAISTEGKIYHVDFVEGRENGIQNDDGVWMPKIEQIEADGDVRFESVHSSNTNSYCAISTDDRVYCWGGNNWGSIGVDWQTPSLEKPTALDTELRFKAVRLGQYATCGLTLDGALYCWGDLTIVASWIQEGQPPDFDETFSHEPVRMDERLFSQLTMSWVTLCAQEQKTQVWHCMGAGGMGRLGNGESAIQDSLVEVATPGAFTVVSNSTVGATMCGIDLEQQVWCWGSNLYGSRGHPTIEGHYSVSTIPERPVWDIPMVDIDIYGVGVVCGVTLNRDIRCWGGRGEGCRLGQPDQGPSDPIYDPQPPIVGIPDDWKKLSSKCVLTEGGDIWCWGLQMATGDPVWPRTCEPTAQRMLTF